MYPAFLASAECLQVVAVRLSINEKESVSSNVFIVTSCARVSAQVALSQLLSVGEKDTVSNNTGRITRRGHLSVTLKWLRKAII